MKIKIKATTSSFLKESQKNILFCPHENLKKKYVASPLGKVEKTDPVTEKQVAYVYRISTLSYFGKYATRI